MCARAAQVAGTSREAAGEDAQGWQKGRGALRAGQVALGTNTPEPRCGSGKTGSEREGPGSPASLAGSPDAAPRIVTSSHPPADGVEEVCVELGEERASGELQ